MKFVLQLVVTLLLSLLVQTFLPWWTMTLVAFVAGYYFNLNGFLSFLAGFLGVGLLWLLRALYMDHATQAILSEKVNNLMPLNVLVMMVLVGGLVGGFAALTGTVLKGKKHARYY